MYAVNPVVLPAPSPAHICKPKSSYWLLYVLYNTYMQTKVLVVAVVVKDGAVLMRKKPDGSAPYKETWYIFGATATPDVHPDDAIKQEVKTKTGIDIAVTNKISWDTEVKHDLDGVEKFFVYLDVLCDYTGGELTPSPDIEKLAWVTIADLPNYDIVPPSKILFKKLGYL